MGTGATHDGGRGADVRARRKEIVDRLDDAIGSDCWLWFCSRVDRGAVKPTNLAMQMCGRLKAWQVVRYAWRLYLSGGVPPENWAISERLLEGKSFVATIGEIYPEWHTHPNVRAFCKGMKLDDCLHAVHMLDVGPRGVTFAGLHFARKYDEGRFGEPEKALVARAMAEHSILSYADVSAHTVRAASALAPRHQVIMPLLVMGQTPAEIAEKLHGSDHEFSAKTVRTYASEIYRAFGVHSQAEFMDAMA